MSLYQVKGSEEEEIRGQGVVQKTQVSDGIQVAVSVISDGIFVQIYSIFIIFTVFQFIASLKNGINKLHHSISDSRKTVSWQWCIINHRSYTTPPTPVTLR